jgi:RNA polymerase sigma factor (TIGR02999 family)
VDTEKAQHGNSRGHFFAAAAEAMRRILVETARRKKAQKRGGPRQRVDLEQVELSSRSNPEAWLLLDDALGRLTEEDPDAAAVAKLRLFAGLSVEEAAAALGVARATAFRSWTYARAWLQAQLQEGDTPQQP